MPFLSDKKHRNKYIKRPDEMVRLRDVELLLRTLSGMQIKEQTKKMMLNRALWLVVELTGNFYCRFRSVGVLEKQGQKIQRDHIYTRKMLVQECLSTNPNFSSIVERAQCCVVTADEHKKLSSFSIKAKNIPGWYRYYAAGVAVRDML